MLLVYVCTCPLPFSSGWHLAWVRVTNMTTGVWSVFPCNQWLAHTEGDKKTVRLLDAVDDAGPQQGGTATAIIGVGPMVPFTSTLLRKMGGTVGQPGYRITFNTSNIVMGGTSAPVFFEMIGEHSSPSRHPLAPH